MLDLLREIITFYLVLNFLKTEYICLSKFYL